MPLQRTSGADALSRTWCSDIAWGLGERTFFYFFFFFFFPSILTYLKICTIERLSLSHFPGSLPSLLRRPQPRLRRWLAFLANTRRLYNISTCDKGRIRLGYFVDGSSVTQMWLGPHVHTVLEDLRNITRCRCKLSGLHQITKKNYNGMAQW